MNMREGDRVSAVALVVEDSGPDAPVDGEEPLPLDLDSGDDAVDQVADGTGEAAAGAVEATLEPEDELEGDPEDDGEVPGGDNGAGPSSD